MAQTILGDEELIAVVMKTVGTNGQISIGSEFSGLPVIAYIRVDNREYKVDDKKR